MTLSMYQASIPVFIRALGNFAGILAKGEAYAQTKSFDPAILVNARLAPDMFPLARQVQIATDSVKGCAARLAGVEVPSFADTETSFAELQARLDRTVKFLQGVTAQQVDGSEDKAIEIKTPNGSLHFTGQDYLCNFVLPNLFFHMTTAYAILRHNGVEIGKWDYLGKAQQPSQPDAKAA